MLRAFFPFPFPLKPPVWPYHFPAVASRLLVMQGSRRSTLKLPLAQEGETCAPTVPTQRTMGPWRVRVCWIGVGWWFGWVRRA